LPTVLSHSKVIKPDAFSAFVFSFRQTRISRDLDIRFLMPLLRYSVISWLTAVAVTPAWFQHVWE